MKQRINFIYQLLIGLLIFFVPSNLFLKFFENSAYVNGLQIDYLIPRIYASDFIIIALFCLYLLENKNKLKKLVKKTYKKSINFSNKNKLFAFLVLALLLRQVNTDHVLSSIWYIIKIIEVGGLIYILKEKRQIIGEKLLIISFLPTVLFQSIIAILQFVNQQAVYGYLLLGEGNLNKQIGLAKQVFGGQEKILPYGTTAHPNILGGFLSISLIIIVLALQSKKLKKYQLLKQPFSLITVFVCFVTIGLTFSWSAWIVLATAIFIYLPVISSKIKLNKKYIQVSLFIIFITPLLIFAASQISESNSIIRRNYLNHAAINMFLSNPIWGVGLNNFTAHVEEHSTVREVVRFTQPAHHSVLLLVAETGLIGLSLLYFVIKKNYRIIKMHKNYIGVIILLIAPIIALDHYLVTNQSGLLLVGILAGLPKNFLFQPQK